MFRSWAEHTRDIAARAHPRSFVGVSQKSTHLAQLTSGPTVVQIWSRNTLQLWRNETLVLHRAARA